MSDQQPLEIQLQFYNTETRRKEVFTAPNAEVRMYTCGPTVYNFAHIGNFRTYVFEDILRRTLKFFGFSVVQVMNITDVDDKTIKGAIENNLSLNDFVQPYIDAFFQDLETLGIEKVEYNPRATDYIPGMIEFIQNLLDKGIAYKSSDQSIYFSLKKFPNYGRLSHLKLDELKLGASEEGIAFDEYEKENATDFVLWKAYDPTRDGKIFWKSPFGPGRPGWHLECSTMAVSLLGKTIDIHVGAVDNIFPHHENEIAQSEAYSGQKFARYWLHSEHLIVNHKKMSKSLGNFYTLRDLLEKNFTGTEIRYMLMQTHYRTQLNFTFEGLIGARNSLNRLNDFIVRMQELEEPNSPPSEEGQAAVQTAIITFKRAMADDLNISEALASIFELMHSINTLSDSKGLTGGDARDVLLAMRQFNQILNVFNFDARETIPGEMQLLLEQRNRARAEKNWPLADQLRATIYEKGYRIEDTPNGARLKKE